MTTSDRFRPVPTGSRNRTEAADTIADTAGHDQEHALAAAGQGTGHGAGHERTTSAVCFVRFLRTFADRLLHELARELPAVADQYRTEGRPASWAAAALLHEAAVVGRHGEVLARAGVELGDTERAWVARLAHEVFLEGVPVEDDLAGATLAVWPGTRSRRVSTIGDLRIDGRLGGLVGLHLAASVADRINGGLGVGWISRPARPRVADGICLGGLCRPEEPAYVVLVGTDPDRLADTWVHELAHLLDPRPVASRTGREAFAEYVAGYLFADDEPRELHDVAELVTVALSRCRIEDAAVQLPGAPRFPEGAVAWWRSLPFAWPESTDHRNPCASQEIGDPS